MPRRHIVPSQVERVVTHIGTKTTASGGIASVLRTYQATPPSGWHQRFLASYVPGTKAYSLIPFLSVACRLVFERRRHLGVVHIHMAQGGSIVRKAVLIRLAHLRSVPVVVSVHSGRFLSILRRHSRLIVWILSPARCVIFLANDVAAEYSQLPGSQPSVVMRNSVIVPPAVTSPEACPPVALFAGDKALRKGVDVLLDAWQLVINRFPTARLLLAGELSELPHDPRPGVEWLGSVSHTDLLGYLDTARVAVLPSRAEGMPMFLLEAMAHARPVVATTVGGIPDLVGDTGRLVSPEDSEGLAVALIDFLADPRLAGEQGALAGERIKGGFSAKDAAARMAAIYSAAAEEQERL